MYTLMQVPLEVRDIRPLGTKVIGDCKSPDLSPRNLTQILCKSCAAATTPSRQLFF